MSSSPVHPAPSVHVVHPGAYLQCTSYLIRGPGGAFLVDFGSGTEEVAVLAGIARAGCTIRDVCAVLLTHAHADHALGAGRFQQRWGVRLVASQATAELLFNGDHQIWTEHPKAIRPATVDIAVTDGQRLDLAGVTVECLCTPGHTRGCASYVLESGGGVAAFTGDLLMPDAVHAGWAGGPDFSVAQTLASLERLLARGVTQVFTGHGAVDGDGRAWLRRGIANGRRGEWIIGRESGAPVVPDALRWLTVEA